MMFLAGALGFFRTKLGMGLLIFLIIAGTVFAIHRNSVRQERARQAVQIERDKSAQRARENVAEQRRRDDEARARADADQRKQEIDDATRNIHDQAPSARQRERALIELRRQCATDRSDSAACRSAFPR